MKHSYFYLRSTIFLIIISILSSSVLMAQKKPDTLRLDVDTDDLQVCGGQGVVEASSKRNTSSTTQQTTSISDTNSGSNDLKNSQFCVLFRAYYYNLNSGNNEGAQRNRNEMIDIVRDQVDIFYKLRKDGRSRKIRIFSTILDFLRIGGEFAVTVMNGERAKTVVGAALGGLTAGQTSYNNNFKILQTQVLINNMTANRAQIMTKIITKKSLGPNDYSWYAAKSDLRQYLFAGTFDDALDRLVEKSGDDAKNAQATLEIVEKKGIAPAANDTDLKDARNAGPVRDEIEAALASNDASRLKTVGEKLRRIIDELDETPELKTLFEREGVDKTTADAQKIYDALSKIIIELPTTQGRKGRDLVQKINEAFTNPL